MYAQDYDSTWVPVYLYDGAPGPTTLHVWGVKLSPYTKNDQILICPSGSYTYTYPDPDDYICSYAINAINKDTSVASGGNGYGMAMANDADIEDPAGTIWAAECVSGMEFNRRSRLNSNGSGGIAKRHNDGFNIAFADGHSKWMNKYTEEMWTLAND